MIQHVINHESTTFTSSTKRIQSNNFSEIDPPTTKYLRVSLDSEGLWIRENPPEGELIRLVGKLRKGEERDPGDWEERVRREKALAEWLIPGVVPVASWAARLPEGRPPAEPYVSPPEVWPTAE